MEKKYKLEQNHIDKIFNYNANDGEYMPGIALINFYEIILNDLVDTDIDKPLIDSKYIYISKKFYEFVMDKIKEDARNAGYPETPDENNEVSIKQGMYQWMNSGPSVDENLDEYVIVIEDNAIIEDK